MYLSTRKYPSTVISSSNLPEPFAKLVEYILLAMIHNRGPIGGQPLPLRWVQGHQP